MAKLKLRHISKTYGDGTRALRDISLSVEDGEFVVLVGPSGCGKSTILRLVAGLEEVSAGEIYLAGKAITGLSPRDRDIAMVFQNYALYPHMTVFDNMAFGLKMHGVSRGERVRRVRETASILGLEDMLDRRPKQLSGGQQQRVALGRAIVRQPKIFLFDEPLSNLDAKLRVAMRSELIRLHRRLAVTMVYVTHDQTEAMSMGDRLVVLQEGRIMQQGRPLDIYHRPDSRFVGGFIGSPPMNFFEVRLQPTAGGVAVALAGRLFAVPDRWRQSLLRFEAGRPVVLGLRPEHFSNLSWRDDRQAVAGLPTRVEFVELLGSEMHVTCSIENKQTVVRLEADAAIKAGMELLFYPDMEKAHFFDPTSGETLRDNINEKEEKE